MLAARFIAAPNSTISKITRPVTGGHKVAAVIQILGLMLGASIRVGDAKAAEVIRKLDAGVTDHGVYLGFWGSADSANPIAKCPDKSFVDGIQVFKKNRA
jgi:hypothetical protein